MSMRATTKVSVVGETGRRIKVFWIDMSGYTGNGGRESISQAVWRRLPKSFRAKHWYTTGGPGEYRGDDWTIWVDA